MSRYTDLLADPRAARYWLVDVAVTKRSDGSSQVLRFTDHPGGFQTPNAGGSATLVYEERLHERPSMAISLFSGDQIGPPATYSTSALVITNADGAFDGLADTYDFEGGTVEVREIGRSTPGNRWLLTEAGLRHTWRLISEPEDELITVRIPIADPSWSLDVDLDVPRYIGGEWALRLDGSTYVDCGDVLDQTGAHTLEAWIYPTDISDGDREIIGKTDWWLRYSFGTGNEGELRYRNSNLTPANTSSGVAVISANTRHHVAMTYLPNLTETAATVSLYVDGALVASQETTHGATDNASNLIIGNNIAGWVYRAAIWNRALSADEIASLPYAQYDGTETGLADAWLVEDATGTTVASVSGSNNGTITGTADWIASLEGGPEGERKPLVLGEAFEVEVTRVSQAKQIGQIHFRDVQSWEALYRNGALESGTVTEAANLNAFLDTDPGAGKYATWSPLGLIRWGTDLVQERLTVHLKGDASGSYVEDAGECCGRVASLLPAERSATITSSSITAFDTAQSGAVGVARSPGEDYNALRLVHYLLQPLGYVVPTTDGDLELGRLGAAIGSPVATITEGDIQLEGITPGRMQLPTRERTVRYARSWTVQTDEEMAGDAFDDPVRRDQVRREWRVARFAAQSPVSGAVSPPAVDSPIAGGSLARAVARELQEMTASRGRTFLLDLRALSAELALGDEISLSHPRFGLSAGNAAIVIQADGLEEVLAWAQAL